MALGYSSRESDRDAGLQLQPTNQKAEVSFFLFFFLALQVTVIYATTRRTIVTVEIKDNFGEATHLSQTGHPLPPINHIHSPFQTTL